MGVIIPERGPELYPDNPGTAPHPAHTHHEIGVGVCARWCAMRFGPAPVEVTIERAPVYPRVIEELVAGTLHVPTSTPTTAWKPTTAGSKPGSGRCAE